ncbi:MAG: hypothetical protein GWN01_14680, partial [Nitrosopumilaceae archaeon]|nr:hypothetical protein [Nitrosopumilaceae archaeon]NIU89053.1 hypothetical protein [Nitrosopumilaceae archaeon]NIV66737.1 hypothetical protein [Nitrosopumilaceae archaeon]NIX62700.1 hypothetical protein [Nitrosopumilaceae archaeon]
MSKAVEEMSRKVISMEEGIRFVGVMDHDGKVLTEATRDGLQLQSKEREVFEIDHHLIRNINSVFDDYLGKVRTMMIIRDKIKQLVFYKNRKIIFVSC